MINLREWALPVYTIMMQMAAGSMLVLWLIYTYVVRRGQQTTADRISHNSLLIIFITAAIAVGGSHFHLSRPFLSILALSNLGTSWLSREVAFTVAFVLLVGLVWVMQRYAVGAQRLRLVTGWLAVLMGLATVYSMAHVYLLPPQVAWNSLTTPVAFFGATFLLGSMAVSALLLMNFYLMALKNKSSPELDPYNAAIRPALHAAAGGAVAALIIELLNYAVQISLLTTGESSARASAELLLGLYGVLFVIRLALLGLGVTGLVVVHLWQRQAHQPLLRWLVPVYSAFLLTLVSEVLGRFLFYAIHVRKGI